jgi:hypothetical protein
MGSPAYISIITPLHTIREMDSPNNKIDPGGGPSPRRVYRRHQPCLTHDTGLGGMCQGFQKPESF